MRDKERVSLISTAHTGGGGASCFHFWSKLLGASLRTHIPTLLFSEHLVGTDAGPYLPPSGRTNPNQMNPQGTSPLRFVSPRQNFTSSLPGFLPDKP